MKIYIPTCGRATRQTTLRCLPPSLLKHTYLVVQHKERKEYARWVDACPGVQLSVLPKRVNTISATRQVILDYHLGNYCDPRLIMLDDDLQFYVRRTDIPSRLLGTTEIDVVNLFNTIKNSLEEFAHVGVAAREGANRNTEEYLYNTRMMRVLGYRADALKRTGFSYKGVKLQEDFHVALHLLTHGYPMRVINHYCQGQGSSGAAGGCSTYRTLELHNKCAQELAVKYPEFVKVVEKTTKTAWGGATRLDVQVAWKKAYAAGKAKYGEQDYV